MRAYDALISGKSSEELGAILVRQILDLPTSTPAILALIDAGARLDMRLETESIAYRGYTPLLLAHRQAARRHRPAPDRGRRAG